MPFQPGNREAAKAQRVRLYADALRIEVMKASGKSTALRRIAAKHVAQALKGDMSAIKEIADRLDGKVPQAVTGEDGVAVVIELVKTFHADKAAE